MLFKVGSDVIAATGGRQRPEISISMYEPYALAPRAAAAGPSGGSAAATDGERLASAERTWALIKDTTSIAVVDDFVSHFADVPVYGALARAKREELVKFAVVAPPPPSAGPLTFAQERGLKPKDSFRDCADCPEMVVLPAGSFMMGSPASEKDRYDDEGPQHIVTINKPFAVGKLHVTVEQFAEFVRETRHEASEKCFKWPSFILRGSWRDPGFAQNGSHPVVCVSWDDANAYANWLAKKTGKPYRLLSESEWEYAARGRTTPGAYLRFWFGDDEKDLCRYGNFADQKSGRKDAPCNDGYERTSPAGHYAPNAFGLYDMFGNAWQWTADCYRDSYTDAPIDGSAWTIRTCSNGHVVRGGSWYSDLKHLRAAQRYRYTVEVNLIGIRVARPLGP
jgi:formylglycine-generating enzyme required for sulfatase activity